MNNRNIVNPDMEFIRRLKNLGGDSVKKCFQCAACSGVCSISPDENPFPRKEMLWAQWGLKDRLLSSPDIWLCHQCNDCSRHCPRESNPADLLAALRQYTIANYAFPRPLARAMERLAYLPILLAVPVLLLLVDLWIRGRLDIPTGDVLFLEFFPHFHIALIFLTAAAFAVIMTAVGVGRFWERINMHFPGDRIRNGKSVGSSLLATGVEILSHSRLGECKENRPMHLGHLAIFYGFLACFFSAFAMFLGVHILEAEVSRDFFSPLKILGNLGGALLLVGCVLILFNRLWPGKNKTRSQYRDWFLPLNLFVVTLTGFLAEAFRLMELSTGAYSVYFLHLVFIFLLVCYLPYSKLAHIAYRTVAIIHSKLFGRYEVDSKTAWRTGG
ncbi:MAG: quinone-interacting membrane-bound oxidoreductase complex subunit QmoC [Deltaproteobacteria bacterium]|nr:quinone-interacting membrane-bound oxidoreductase complex subunit QmoC [Deltaproteobacteria bacterium]